jgi:AraC-like DNA-binding protein
MPLTLKNLSHVNHQAVCGSVVFGDVEYGPGGVCGPRVQRDYQWVAVVRGSLELQLDDNVVRVPSGSGILLTPGHRETFNFSREAPTRHVWCSVAPSSVPSVLRSVLRKGPGPSPVTASVDQLLGTGLDLAPGIGEAVTLHLALALLGAFAQSARSGRGTARPGDERILRVDHFISREYHRSLALIDLARAAGVSRQHLLKLFREAGRPSPMALLQEERLRQARNLLIQTGLPIGEIAERCGFANPFHFSRTFRSANGVTPRDFRSGTWRNASARR